MENYYIKRNDTIELDHIVLLEALENYTLFHLKDGSKVISSTTLKRHQENLVIRTFLRVNRSTLINADFVKSVYLKNDVNFVKLKTGQEIKVSRRRRDTLELLQS